MYAHIFFYRQFIAHYVMSLLTAILSVAFIALPIVGIVWCSGEVSHYYVRINRVNYKKNVTCPDNKTAALVTGGLAAVDSFLICVWCILGTVFFCCFVRSYGFQNRGKRYLWCNIYYIHDIKQWTVQFNIVFIVCFEWSVSFLRLEYNSLNLYSYFICLHVLIGWERAGLC